jgi:hypothetical protein
MMGRARGPRFTGALLGGLLLLGMSAVVLAQGDPDRLRNAKALFFDRKYAEARQAWEAIQAGRGPEAEAAPYWIARCSESLGEFPRALGEYGAYLAARPADRALAEEARTSRVSLAARLYKSGQKQHLPILREALTDSSRTVRYFGALQMLTLGCDVGRAALPVLKKMLAEEKDEDLIDRARLALLRCDPGALGASPAPPANPPGLAPSTPPRAASWIRVRIYQKGAAKPQVSVNLPVALAEMVFKSLPEEARAELRRKGYDADNFWDRLKKLGPTEIISIEGDDGERVQIWLE